VHALTAPEATINGPSHLYRGVYVCYWSLVPLAVVRERNSNLSEKTIRFEHPSKLLKPASGYCRQLTVGAAPPTGVSQTYSTIQVSTALPRRVFSAKWLGCWSFYWDLSWRVG